MRVITVEERFYNLLCLAFGTDPVQFSDLENYLPLTRSPSCRYEYQTLIRAFHMEIGPHIDREMVRRYWIKAGLQTQNQNSALTNRAVHQRR
jgi:Putative metallopeptidase